MTRRRAWRPTLTMVGALLAIIVAAGSCSRPADQRTSAERRDDAIRKAATYVGANLGSADTTTKAIAANLGRRYGLAELERWRDAARAEFASPKPNAGPYAALGARILDPNATVDTAVVDALPHEQPLQLTNWLLATALHCDEPAFPADWVDVADRALDNDPQGAYVTTHVGLAVAALDERHCAPAGIDGVRTRTVDALAKALQQAPAVDDITLERIATLGELGRSDRVDRSWMDRVLAAQHDDGGYARTAGDAAADWHPTVLALWALAANRDPTMRTPIFS